MTGRSESDSTRLPSPEGVRVAANPGVERAGPYPERHRRALCREAARAARREIRGWPGYRPTPLRELSGLAAAADVGGLWYKDEGERFGLGAFKALGGAYGVLWAVGRELARRGEAAVARNTRGSPAPGSGKAGSEGEDDAGESIARSAHAPPVPSAALLAGRHREAVSRLAVTCASEGNHGRAVAWGAELFGCRAVVYLPAEVSEAREAAIASHGAETARVEGGYDRAVRRAAEDARRKGLLVVADTAAAGVDDEIPRRVMQGYGVLFEELLEQLPDGEPPTHAFVQAGVGGVAAAACAALWERWGPGRPRLVVVEAREAAALMASARAGERREVEGPFGTIMGGLACGEPSPAAWSVLRDGADAFLALPDAAARATMRLLARGTGGDPPVVAGESGAAGTAALLAAAADAGLRERLGLDESSRVLVVGTEGATDPAAYREIVGRAPGEVGGG